MYVYIHIRHVLIYCLDQNEPFSPTQKFAFRRQAVRQMGGREGGPTNQARFIAVDMALHVTHDVEPDGKFSFGICTT